MDDITKQMPKSAPIEPLQVLGLANVALATTYERKLHREVRTYIKACAEVTNQITSVNGIIVALSNVLRSVEEFLTEQGTKIKS